MKLVPVLLGISLAANAALIATRHSAAGAAERVGKPPAGAAAPSGVGATAPGEGAGLSGTSIANAVQSGDMASLRDGLRAGGVPEDVVRSVISMLLWKQHSARMQELTNGAMAKEWWKQEDWSFSGRTKEQREEMRGLQKKAQAEIERLLGPDPEPEKSNPWLARQYGFLPKEKRDALMKIEQDYQELQSELQQDSGSFQMPEDREKMRFLAEEKKRDMASVLSPEELEAYEMRQSSTANNLRWQMTQMNATEEEYRAIYAIRREFDEQYNQMDQFGQRSMSQDDWKKRNEAEKAMREQIKAALGEDRYKAYAYAQNHEYQQLQGATKRFGLPEDTPMRVLGLRDQISVEGNRIADDKNLTPEQKGEALRKLAADGRQKLNAFLGAEVAEAYKANTGARWLDDLEKGSIYTYDENGSTRGRSVDIRSKPETKK